MGGAYYQSLGWARPQETLIPFSEVLDFLLLASQTHIEKLAAKLRRKLIHQRYDGILFRFNRLDTMKLFFSIKRRLDDIVGWLQVQLKQWQSCVKKCLSVSIVHF